MKMGLCLFAFCQTLKFKNRHILLETTLFIFSFLILLQFSIRKREIITNPKVMTLNKIMFKIKGFKISAQDRNGSILHKKSELCKAVRHKTDSPLSQKKREYPAREIQACVSPSGGGKMVVAGVQIREHFIMNNLFNQSEV